MRKAGRLAAEILDLMVPEVNPGVNTSYLDKLAFDYAVGHGALPACLGYRGYRHTLCTSINHVVCHGIPSDRPLKDGDILNIDVTVVLDGWHGDTSRMYYVGDVKRKAQRLVEIPHEAKRTQAAGPGANTGDIGYAIQSFAEDRGALRRGATSRPCLGRISPRCPTSATAAPVRALRQPGMFFTVEPMINSAAMQ
jgi:methionyl aminopeptidase